LTGTPIAPDPQTERTIRAPRPPILYRAGKIGGIDFNPRRQAQKFVLNLA